MGLLACPDDGFRQIRRIPVGHALVFPLQISEQYQTLKEIPSNVQVPPLGVLEVSSRMIPSRVIDHPAGEDP
jgi:hypothetical protein